jgi:hypothetical protein
VQKVLTKHFKTLILKVAFVIIRRLQKPHYSQKQKSNKNKNAGSPDSIVAIFKLSRPQQQQNSGLSALLAQTRPAKTNPKQQKSQTKRHPSQGVFLLP